MELVARGARDGVEISLKYLPGRQLETKETTQATYVDCIRVMTIRGDVGNKVGFTQLHQRAMTLESHCTCSGKQKF